MARKSLVAAPHPLPTCDEHLAAAMRQVTPQDGDHGTDSNVMVRRLEGGGIIPACHVGVGKDLHPSTWVLQLVGVFR